MGTSISFKRPDGKDAGGYLVNADRGNAPGVVVIPDRDLCAGSDKTLGDRAPKALRAAGDDGASAVQIDLVHGAAL